ncbi:MAG: hypothetical protein E4H21_08160 [Thermodesulfobacteriales bacterium]|nr:MAG: hypothetical protein E4H21_08160 [Thermodesulfobacteriales bacterium]
MLRSFILFAGLVLALGLAGCPQQAEEPAGEVDVVVEEVQDADGDTAEMAEEVVEEAPAADDATDSANDTMDKANEATQ